MTNFGYKISLITTTLIYIVIGIVSVRLYDHYKGGPLSFIESWKLNKEDEAQTTRLNYIISFFGKVILSIVLSFKNTGLFVLVFRKGSYLFNGFAGKYIKLIFLINSFLINVIWNIVIYYLSPIFIMIWEIIKVIFSIMAELHFIIY